MSSKLNKHNSIYQAYEFHCSFEKFGFEFFDCMDDKISQYFSAYARFYIKYP